MIFVSTALVSGVDFPETKRTSKNEQAFRDEYKQFLRDFLFPLLGNDSVNLEEVYSTKTEKNLVIEQEGDTMNKPPRASILVEIIMLQSLSILLQNERNLTPQQYVKWHPGGSLGKSIRDTEGK